METPSKNVVEAYFRRKLGIFENTDNPEGISKLKSDFESECKRLDDEDIRISFDFAPIKIEQLRSRINALENAHPAQLSHLAVFYGLDDEDTNTSMKLIFRGMHLSKDMDIILYDEPKGSYEMPLICPSSEDAEKQQSGFRSTFDSIHGEHKHINGCYLKLHGNVGGSTGIGLFNLLDIFQRDNCDLVNISFGFMDPGYDAPKDVDAGLTCFHMIFTGLRSKDESYSCPRIFSTFDNDSGYSGPKPACPPFCPK